MARQLRLFPIAGKNQRATFLPPRALRQSLSVRTTSRTTKQRHRRQTVLHSSDRRHGARKMHILRSCESGVPGAVSRTFSSLLNAEYRFGSVPAERHDDQYYAQVEKQQCHDAQNLRKTFLTLALHRHLPLRLSAEIPVVRKSFPVCGNHFRRPIDPAACRDGFSRGSSLPRKRFGPGARLTLAI